MESREEEKLPTEMAKLDIMEIDEDNSREKPVSESRVLRKRKSLASELSKPSNRRVSMRPRKHNVLTENASPKQIEALYLNKKVKTLSQTLETIYEDIEDPKPNNETESFIGGRKVKRLLTFQLGNHYTKDKIKKRRAKIKKLLGNRGFLTRKKIPMKAFLETINSLELDEIQTESVITSTNDTIDKV